MRRIFVVGCPRSGTTLVQAMIARHPDVFSLRETYFFESLLGDAELRWGDREARSTRRWYHRAGIAQSWGRRHLRELEGVHLDSRRRRSTPRGWIACTRRYVAMLDSAARSAGRTSWVEKSPGHLLYLVEIAKCIPDARFVHVLRDGMNVVASVTDADMRRDTAGFRGGIAQWTRRWNHAMETHLARLDDPRHYLLCVEDLIGNTEKEWQMLRDFLGLDPGKPLLARPGSEVADAQAETWKASAISGIAKSVSGKSEALFGPQSVSWLRQHLVSYETVRDMVREQHLTNPAGPERQGEPAERRSAIARKPGGPRRTVERRVRPL